MPIPPLDGTERLVPQKLQPRLPPFPTFQCPTAGNATLLVIPTENKEKMSVIQECLAELAPKAMRIHTVVILVESEVGEQPYNEAGPEGVYNRIKNALDRLQDKKYNDLFTEKGIGTVMVVSIENYIQTEDVNRPTDFGLIAIHNATTQQTIVSSSKGVTVPPEYVSRARRLGHDGNPNHGNVTVGHILASERPMLNKANWQVVLAGHSRYELLKEAMRAMPIPW